MVQTTERGELVPAAKAATAQDQMIATFEKNRVAIEQALPKHLDADRMVKLLATCVRETPKLGHCTPRSVLSAVMTCTKLGLEPSVGGECWLLPFKNKGVLEATFVGGYKGYVKLFYQHPMAGEIWAEVVYEGDEFTEILGSERELVHKRGPNYDPKEGNWKKITHVYACARLTTGGKPFIVLTRDEVEFYRQKSKAPNSPAWVRFWPAMAKKTAALRLMPWLPKSTQLSELAAHDERAEEAGLVPAATIIDVPLLETLPEPEDESRGAEDTNGGAARTAAPPAEETPSTSTRGPDEGAGEAGDGAPPDASPEPEEPTEEHETETDDDTELEEIF